MELSEMEFDNLLPKLIVVLDKLKFIGIIQIDRDTNFSIVDSKDTAHPLYPLIKDTLDVVQIMKEEEFEEDQTQKLFSKKNLESTILTNLN